MGDAPAVSVPVLRNTAALVAPGGARSLWRSARRRAHGLCPGLAAQALRTSARACSHRRARQERGRVRTEDVDICIIGSGAGGAVLAYEAARKGLRTLVVERGP